jgi:hypothetical protein
MLSIMTANGYSSSWSVLRAAAGLGEGATLALGEGTARLGLGDGSAAAFALGDGAT